MIIKTARQRSKKKKRKEKRKKYIRMAIDDRSDVRQSLFSFFFIEERRVYCTHIVV